MLVRLARGRAANSVETGEQLDITLEWLFGNPESPLSGRTWGSLGGTGGLVLGGLMPPPKRPPALPRTPDNCGSQLRRDIKWKTDEVRERGEK